MSRQLQNASVLKVDWYAFSIRVQMLCLTASGAGCSAGAAEVYAKIDSPRPTLEKRWNRPRTGLGLGERTGLMKKEEPGFPVEVVGEQE